jgi:hypothetical protein
MNFTPAILIELLCANAPPRNVHYRLNVVSPLLQRSRHIRAKIPRLQCAATTASTQKLINILLTPQAPADLNQIHCFNSFMLPNLQPRQI